MVLLAERSVRRESRRRWRRARHSGRVSVEMKDEVSQGITRIEATVADMIGLLGKLTYNSGGEEMKMMCVNSMRVASTSNEQAWVAIR